MLKITKDKLLVGPWVGEWGWELMCWQAYARSLSRHYTYTSVFCPPGSEYFYQDFANAITLFDPGPGIRDACWHSKFQFIKHGYPNLEQLNIAEPFGVVTPEFIKFGHKYKTQPYIVIHARARKYLEDRNWPLEEWNKLTNKLHSAGVYMIAIGTEAYVPEHAIHANDTCPADKNSLEHTCDVIYNANLVIGQSSGPIHLAAICGTQLFTWYEWRGSHASRLVEFWNPFRVKVSITTKYGWHPPPEEIYTTTMELLDE
jgi:ADP-heptose:LPS heptosyltransferase